MASNEQGQKIEPLSEQEERAWREELNKVIWTWTVSYPAKFVQRLVLTLDAERTERQRVEAELEELRGKVATLSEALQPFADMYEAFWQADADDAIAAEIGLAGHVYVRPFREASDALQPPLEANHEPPG